MPYKKLFTIFIASLGLGLLFDYLFYQAGQLGINFPIYVAIIFVLFLLLAALFKVKINRAAYIYIPVALFFAGFVAIRASEFLTFWNIVITMIFLLLFASHILGRAVTGFGIAGYLQALVLISLSFLGKSFRSVVDLISIPEQAKAKDRALPITRGILITLPIIVFFILLFSSADQVFGRYVSNIFRFHLEPETIGRSVLVLVVTFVFLGALRYVLEFAVPKTISVPQNPEPRPERFGSTEITILLTALNVLFLAFIAVQFKYFFAGESAVSGLGFTYSDYARRGFFELITASIFTFLLLWVVDRMLARREKTSFGRFKFLGSVLIIQVGVVMISAFQRLALYEEAYGFTDARFCSHVLIIWLAVIFVILAYKIWRRAGETRFIFSVFVSWLAMFAILNFFNPDAFIARQNIEHYSVSGKLDLVYLNFLSADAAPEVFGILDMKNIPEDMKREDARLLLDEPNFSNPSDKWQAWHFSISKARDTFIRYEQRANQLTSP